MKLVICKKSMKTENHHLWYNRGVWWIALTFFDEETFTKSRQRFSLQTTKVEKARKIRDAIIKDLEDKEVYCA